MTPEMRQDGMERAYREGLGRASSMDDDECSAIAPLVADLEGWMRTTRAKLSRHADVAKAMDYMLKRWESFNRFLNGGRICLSNNAAERALRGVAVGRKACLFAGSNRGGERAAAMYSLIVTARLNDVDPRAWLADVLRRIGDTPPPDCTGCCRGIGDPKVR
jgi:transposase